MVKSNLAAVNDNSSRRQGVRTTNLVKLRQQIESRRRAHLAGKGKHLADPLDEAALSLEGKEVAEKFVLECEWEARREILHEVRVDKMIGEFALEELFGLMEEISSDRNLNDETREKALEAIRKRIDRRLDEEDDPSKSSYHLFEGWAPSYDPHMAETNHDAAGETAFKQALELRKMNFGGGPIPILGTDVLEMSGGTGTFIGYYRDHMPPEELARMQFTLNDQSPRMMRKAMDKLGDDCSYTFTYQDLRDPQAQFWQKDPQTGKVKQPNCVVLANTVNILADPELLRLEKGPDAVMENPDHRRIKTEVIKKAFAALEDFGYFVLLDEWPAKLSDNPRNPVEKVLERLFKENFRPLASRSIFRDKIMKNIPGALFVCELKARIDSKHSMYMIIYRKDPARMENDLKRLPSHQVDATVQNMDIGEVDRARSRAAHAVHNAFTAIDTHFIKTYKPVNGERKNWTEFIPIGAGTEVNPPIEALEAGRRYDTIVISRQLHNLDEERRKRYFKLATEALNSGGALMVIDEWDPPSNAPHPINRRAFRDGIMEEYADRFIFEACLRQTVVEGFQNGMFGYLYRKIR